MEEKRGSFFNNIFSLILIFSFIKLLIHLYTNASAGYGYFRDELYYIACSNHLSAGYVDHPPLSIFILKISLILFGDSLFALRLLPAFAGATTVFITGLIVKEFNGGKFAVALASLSVILAPVYLGMNTYYSMNSFDILLWALAAYQIIILIKNNSSKNWIILGIILGLGLLNKVGFLWLCFGLFVGLILTEQRKNLKTPWPYISGGIAFLIFSPFIIWNFVNDFAHIEFMQNAVRFKYSSLTRADFLTGQVLLMNPITLPVWISGLYFFIYNNEGKKYKILGIIYLSAFTILLINGQSKAEYLASAYTMLFAGGSVLIEKYISSKIAWLKYSLAAFVLISGIILAPLALPILPVKTYISYSKSLGFGPSTSENIQLQELPQFYADMFGWENMAKTVSSVYQSLSEEEKKRTIVFANNYGEAGAIDFFSKKYELPRVISPHNSYWLWGKNTPENFDNIIIIGGEKEDHLEALETVEEAARINSEYAIPYETDLPVYLGKKLIMNFNEIWERSRLFI